MKEEFFYPSCGKGKIHACIWCPEERPRAIVQIVHGIAEHIERYDHFAQYLVSQGIAVVAEDHMGHGKSSFGENIRGYFYGGWFAAVQDSVKLIEIAKEKLGDLPYFVFGHSMGSFMARTILIKYPELNLAGCIICGTGWLSKALVVGGTSISKFYCKNGKDKEPNKTLQKIMFGGYNKRVEHQRTGSDWLTRDNGVVDKYEEDPLCGFVPTAGLVHDMVLGIGYIQKKDKLTCMNKALPCYFIAGGDDPVGDYGKAVMKAANVFRKIGMESVDLKLYPMCRHEILNELNKHDVYSDVLKWISKHI